MSTTATQPTHDVSAELIYTGAPDYWQGNGDRWDDANGCLFAYYDCHTTIGQMIGNWIDDYNNGGDCDNLPESVTEIMIRTALVSLINPPATSNSLFAPDCEVDYDADDSDDRYDSPFAIVLIRTWESKN